MAGSELSSGPTGEPLKGLWFGRMREWAARNRGEEPENFEYATEEVIHLEPLLCWRHLSPEKVRARVAELIDQVVAEAEEERRRTGPEVLGAAAAEDQNPLEMPVKVKKSPAPLVHAATRAARKEMKEAYAFFLTAFPEASANLRAGDREAMFPPGSFPPVCRLSASIPWPSLTLDRHYYWRGKA